MQETWVQSLGWEDPLEKGKAQFEGVSIFSVCWLVSSLTLILEHRSCGGLTGILEAPSLIGFDSKFSVPTFVRLLETQFIAYPLRQIFLL